MLGVVLGAGLPEGRLGLGRDLREFVQVVQDAVAGCLHLAVDERKWLVPVRLDEGVVAGVHVDVAVSERSRPDLLQGVPGLGEPARELRDRGPRCASGSVSDRRDQQPGWLPRA